MFLDDESVVDLICRVDYDAMVLLYQHTRFVQYCYVLLVHAYHNIWEYWYWYQ